ncbi:hypothetical protein SAMN04488123_1248 [Natribacillus halophilus]|uniref:Uncharacterized protein n=1 Tax=Natribacillus halophilus TaxID=549003 RepID=A0A1G8S8J7_9BACI|nr:hypothetical protein SAMN04488123_1248 [Natribacillus halophilus]
MRTKENLAYRQAFKAISPSCTYAGKKVVYTFLPANKDRPDPLAGQVDF